MQVTGILTIESFHRGSWRRIIFLAEALPIAPAEESAADSGGAVGPRFRCKTVPDVESAGACWAAAGELEELPLRNAPEPLTWIPWVAEGGHVMGLGPEDCPDRRKVVPDIAL